MVQSIQSKTVWRKYRLMASKKPLESNELYHEFEKIYYGDDRRKGDPEIAAALCVAWIWGLRVGELVDTQTEKLLPLKPPFDKLIMNKFGPRVENFWEVETEGNVKVYAAILRNRKGKPQIQKSLQKFGDDHESIFYEIKKRLEPKPVNAIPILVIRNNKRTLDWDFVNLLRKYIFEYIPQVYSLNLENDNHLQTWKTTPLFPLKKYELINRLKSWKSDWTWHIFRKQRVTFLSSKMNFSINDLMHFIGWKSAGMATTYVQSGEWSIMKRFNDFYDNIESDELLDENPDNFIDKTPEDNPPIEVIEQSIEQIDEDEEVQKTISEQNKEKILEEL